MKKTRMILLSLALAAAMLVLGACNSGSSTAESEEDIIHPWANYQVIVNGQPVPGAFLLEGGGDAPTYVTLMPVLAALGAEGINVDSGEVTLEGVNGSISFTVWSNDFAVNGDPIDLVYESFEIDGTIYVPILFFRDVFGMERAVFHDGHVFIDNEISDME